MESEELKRETRTTHRLVTVLPFVVVVVVTF